MNHGYLYTKDLTVGYNGIPLIRNIQLEINKGEIVTLIGPNGAGKTTILRSIIQQLPPVWRCMVRWTTGGENAGQRNGAKAVRCIDRTGKS